MLSKMHYFLGLTLQQIMDVDEKNQILTTNIWLNLVRDGYFLLLNYPIFMKSGCLFEL